MTADQIRALVRSSKEIDTGLGVNQVSTTDATVTMISSVVTDDFDAGILEYMVIGMKDDGESAVSVKRICRYVNNGSTIAIGTQQDILPLQTEVTGATVTASVNVFNIEITVKGAASTNIDWICYVVNRFVNNFSGGV